MQEPIARPRMPRVVRSESELGADRECCNHAGGDFLRRIRDSDLTPAGPLAGKYDAAVRVLVTGGTGFVGSHSVAALLGAGHEVRLLVRDSARVERALGPLNVSVSDVVVGDMTDPEAVTKAVQGRDAVVHAAALFTFDPRRIANIGATNVRGTEVVLEAARKAGCDPVVHVSSFAALLPQNGRSPRTARLEPFTRRTRGRRRSQTGSRAAGRTREPRS